MVVVNIYWINQDDGDDTNRNGYRNKAGEDVANSLRINNAVMRESQFRRLGELRDNRDKNKVREALNRLERSAAFSEDDVNDNNGINNRNNKKTTMTTGEEGMRLHHIFSSAYDIPPSVHWTAAASTNSLSIFWR